MAMCYSISVQHMRIDMHSVDDVVLPLTNGSVDAKNYSSSRCFTYVSIAHQFQWHSEPFQ
jgi:hypothetical protein